MKRYWMVLPVVVALWLFSGCGGKNPAESGGNYSIDGYWVGKTSYDDDFSFRVKDDWIREINLPAGTYTSSMISYIENNSFSYALTNFRMDGSFTSSKSASGTIRDGAFQGTWSASKR